MPELHVFFWGLICHISDPQNQSRKIRAAMVQTDDHVPQLILGPAARRRILRRVRFIVNDRTTNGAFHVDGSFKHMVPSLHDILGAPLKPCVESGEDTDLAAYVEYPGSSSALDPRLDAVSFYSFRAEHRHRNSNPSDQPRRNGAVARLLRAIVNIDASELKIELDGRILDDPIELPGCVLFANVEIRASDPHPRECDVTRPSHFEHYTKLLQTSQTAVLCEFPITREAEPLSQCGWVLDVINHAAKEGIDGGVKPECGNTTFP